MEKKAQAKEPLKIIIAIVVLLALALVVYIAFIKPSGTSASKLFGSIGSCTDPIVGKQGVCDCFFPAEAGKSGTCPADSEGTINENCPKVCSEGTYVTDVLKSQKEYKAKVKLVEDQAKPQTLSPDMVRAIQADFFGQCCKGATKAAVQK